MEWVALAFVLGLLGFVCYVAGKIIYKEIGWQVCGQDPALRDAIMFIKAHGLHDKYKEFIK